MMKRLSPLNAFPMKTIYLLIFAIVPLLPHATAQNVAIVGRSDDGHAVATFTLPLSEDEGSLKASFDFGLTKGFLGPSANPSDQTGFSNADKTLVALNHQPVTKSSYVHLFLRSASGDLTFLNNVNDRVSRLLKERWAGTAKYFLRVERVSGRAITLQTVDFTQASRERYEFTITVSSSGSISLAK
jgi:hypothetical protein